MQEITITALHQCFITSCGVCTDTRNIAAESLFIALKGEQFDGNLFVKQAISSGAKYAVTSNAEFADGVNVFFAKDTLEALQALANYHRRQFSIPVIAITGSNGKTTTKELFNAVLSKKYKSLCTKGNLNNHIGVPLTLLRLNQTHEIAIIEMGANHQGEIDLLSRIAEPTIGLITNIGKAHLEGFGGIKGVIKGKTELFNFLHQHNGMIVFNADNSILKEKANSLNKLTYAFNEAADCQGTITNEQPFLSLSYCYKNELDVKVKSNMIGIYNAENILSAICVAKYFNVSDQLIAEAIETYAPDNSRSQIKKQGNTTIILDAYNANPSSMKAALDNFLKMEAIKKIVVLGDMFELGETSAAEHENIIKEALKGNYSKLIFVGSKFGAFKTKFDAIFYENTALCGLYLSELKEREFTILIKGSRGMKLETLLASIYTGT